VKPKVMIIEGCDFRSFPVGGQLTHAVHLIQIFGDRLALVGVSTDDTPVGAWTKKQFNGVTLDFFSIGRCDPALAKPLLPRRLTVLLRLKHYRKEILSLGVGSAFVEAPEVMLAVANWGLRICYKFSGVENPLAMPRYPAGRLLAARFEKMLFAALAARAELILAASDRGGIDRMVARSRGVLTSRQIVQYPTRVDTAVFEVRREAAFGCQPVFVSCGRLNRVKGWDLILDAFALVREQLPSGRLCFVGDGEDREELLARVAGAGLQDSVSVTGFLPAPEVAGLLNEGSVFLMGSHREGWPIAMLEALACGLPVVSTRVSGAGDLIEPGRNGYLVDSRDPVDYACRMIAALQLETPNPVSLEIARRYALDRLAGYLEATWEPLRG
jgi:glycosyltransferase involved in cell wall biosynthesis